MNVYAIILSLLSLLCCVFAIPASPRDTDPDTAATILDILEPVATERIALVDDEERHVRLSRATCDLLSMDTPWGSANHSICAAHCLAMMRGFRGGRCRDGVCHCRK